MKVTLRQKPLQDGQQSLYLDFYPPITHPDTGKPTRREFLSLYLHGKPRTELERTHNRQTRLLAENIRANRQLEVQAGRFGFLAQQLEPPATVDFMVWFKEQATRRYKTSQTKSRSNWLVLHSHLVQFAGESFPASAVTEGFCRDFKDYLSNAKNMNTQRLHNQTLAYGTTVSYFILFKTAINLAVQEGILATNVVKNVKPFKPKKTERAFLSQAELQAMAKADCDIPELKRAGLFSAMTGLRYSDIEKLVWGEVHDDANGIHLRYTQQKTKESETLPINAVARALLGERAEPNERIFPHLLYSSHQNMKLHQWALAAGITRSITFHAFRHTFATLQLQHGTDIYTVSKLMGHQDLKSTQIYARIVNEQKRVAVDKLSIDL